MRTHQPEYEEIASLAYQYYVDEGKPEGRAEIHWMRALKELGCDAQQEEYSVPPPEDPGQNFAS